MLIQWLLYGRRVPTRKSILRKGRKVRRPSFRKNPAWLPVAAEQLEQRVLLSATIATDLLDYPPGATAVITGTGFQAGETVELQVLHIDGTPNTGHGHDPWYVTDGGEGDLDGLTDGNILTTWYVHPDDSADSAFELTALGLTSGEFATHFFTDSAQSAPSTPDLHPDSDTGVSNSDNITGDTTPTFTGTVTMTNASPVTVRLYATDSSMVTTQVGSTTVTGSNGSVQSWTITSSALAEGTYTFTATAAHQHGASSPTVSSPSSGLSVTIDNTDPITMIAFPSQDDPMAVVVETYTMSTWNAGGANPAAGDISGTVEDPIAGGASSGVDKVEVSVQRDSTGKYWDGLGFNSDDEVFFEAMVGGGEWSLDFAFTNFPSDGVYTIRAHATDIAGNEESSGPFAAFQVNVNVLEASLQDDPLNPGMKMLVIQGTPDDDAIVVSPTGNTGGVVVNVWNGTAFAPIFTYDVADGPLSRIVAYGGDGDDDIQIAGKISYDAWLYGEAGDDRLKGGAGKNVLIGGDGDDLLIGGGGANLLIGGNGSDRLIGNGGDDILVAGWTDFDGPATGQAALKSIMDAWCGNGSYATRADAVKGILMSATHDDEDRDLLTGASGNDLYFASLASDGDVDKVTDLGKKEEVVAE